MMELLSQISISEIILVFVLLFVLPISFIMARRLRHYEKMLIEANKPAAGTAKSAAPAPAVVAGPPKPPPNVYPYKKRSFLSPPELACLGALREAFGDEVEVFPKVALWTCVETTDKAPGFAERLHNLEYDFLVCDRKVGQPMTAIMFKPGKGQPASRLDEVRKVSEAAGANVVVLDQQEDYDVKTLKNALGIPELDGLT